jgi:hypothetical protein
MDRVYRRDLFYINQIITGPQCLLLMLDMQPERIDDPFVSPIDVCPIYGQPTDEVVRSAVLSGSDRANAEFGTSWHPLEIRYSYSGWNTERCDIMGQASYNIVAALAKLGPAGIETLA